MGIDHQREEGAVSARIRKLRLDAATVIGLVDCFQGGEVQGPVVRNEHSLVLFYEIWEVVT